MKLHCEIQAELDRLKAQRVGIDGAIQALEWALAKPVPAEPITEKDNVTPSEQ